MDEIILCIDVGNTRFKWAEFDINDLRTGSQGVSDDISEMFAAISGLQSMPVYISLVSSGQIKKQLTDWFRSNWKISPVFLHTQAQFGSLKNAYSRPGDLGVDRWLAMIAAQSLCEGSYCVIDAGTATTIDMVDSDGRHKGGVILPGIQLMVTALNHNTANINVGDGEIILLADNTSDAVSSGAMSAWLGGISRVLDALLQASPEMTVFVTGGDQAQLHRLNTINAIFKKELVLTGIGRVVRENYA